MAYVKRERVPNPEGFLPPVGSHGIPRMKVDSNSPIADLLKWDQMYQSRFFNPDDKIIGEKDVSDVLNYHEPQGPCPLTGLNVNARHQERTKLRPRHYPRVNQRAHHNKISHDLDRILPPIRTSNRLPKSSTSREIHKKTDDITGVVTGHTQTSERTETVKFPEITLSRANNLQFPEILLSRSNLQSGIKKPSSAKSLSKSVKFDSQHEERKREQSRILSEFSKDTLSLDDRGLKSDFEMELQLDLPEDKSRLLRKPLKMPPSSRDSVGTCSIDGPLAENLCAWNYVTYEDEAPFTANSFYVHNYPLLLMRIPKRAEDEQEAESAWRPILATPDIDLSYFDHLPTKELSWYSLPDSDNPDSNTSLHKMSEQDVVSNPDSEETND